MQPDGLDAEKLELLLRWAQGLERDEREEVAAAGRAIVMLVEEIERLHVLLWDLRLHPDVARVGIAEPVVGVPAEPAASLLRRVRTRLARDPSTD